MTRNRFIDGLTRCGMHWRTIPATSSYCHRPCISHRRSSRRNGRESGAPVRNAGGDWQDVLHSGSPPPRRWSFQAEASPPPVSSNGSPVARAAGEDAKPAETKPDSPSAVTSVPCGRRLYGLLFVRCFLFDSRLRIFNRNASLVHMSYVRFAGGVTKSGKRSKLCVTQQHSASRIQQ